MTKKATTDKDVAAAEGSIFTRVEQKQVADAVEIHHLAVQIIQHFHVGRLFMEEHLCAACKRLYVRRMLRKYFNDPLRQTVLPTYVRQRSSHFLVSTKSLPIY